MNHENYEKILNVFHEEFDNRAKQAAGIARLLQSEKNETWTNNPQIKIMLTAHLIVLIQKFWYNNQAEIQSYNHDKKIQEVYRQIDRECPELLTSFKKYNTPFCIIISIVDDFFAKQQDEKTEKLIQHTDKIVEQYYYNLTGQHGKTTHHMICDGIKTANKVVYNAIMLRKKLNPSAEVSTQEIEKHITPIITKLATLQISLLFFLDKALEHTSAELDSMKNQLAYTITPETWVYQQERFYLNEKNDLCIREDILMEAIATTHIVQAPANADPRTYCPAMHKIDENDPVLKEFTQRLIQIEDKLSKI